MSLKLPKGPNLELVQELLRRKTHAEEMQRIDAASASIRPNQHRSIQQKKQNPGQPVKSGVQQAEAALEHYRAEHPPSEIPLATQFYLGTPIYKPLRFDWTNFEKIFAIEYYTGTLDCYCLDCKMPSTFKSCNTPHSSHPQFDYCSASHDFETHFYCSRNNEHLLSYYCRVFDLQLIKIGQFPSLADLARPELQKYRSILGSRFAEFTRGVGLHAHGIGIGAFAYLRRVFESLIDEAHQAGLQEPGWDDEKYRQSRMGEKIKLLENHLPPFLVENRQVYSIMSDGLHNLSEEDCLKYFSPTQHAIELILDQKIENTNRRKKEEDARKEILSIAAALSLKSNESTANEGAEQ